jgi:class 3 adenylate cyclase
MFFAATYPERTDALVLVNTAARALRADDYPLGSRAEQVWKNLDAAKPRWGSGVFGTLAARSRADDDSFRRWHGRYERMTMSPTSWRALVEWTVLLDVREVLPAIRVPTLVLHSEGNAALPPDLARYVADNIPGARLVVLPGADLTLYGETSDAFLDHVEEFVTGVRPERDPDRVLATVLFTDVVGSTEHAARLGDRRWTTVLKEHDVIVSRELDRHRGRKVNPTGDGVLATFDGPARAVRCAQEICAAVRSLGIEVRAGLHTGEVELREDDIGGIAVHIGQRVSAIARPSEVLVSRTVTDLVAGSGLEFDERGEYELKGVPGRWSLFAVKP